MTGFEGGERSLPPIPTLVMESASTSGHELKWDQDPPLTPTPPTPPPKPFFSSSVFTPSPPVPAHIVADMPLSPPGSGDSEGGISISSLATSATSKASPLLVPPPPPSPPQLMLQSSMHKMSPSTDIGAAADIDLAPASSDVGLDVTHIRDPKISSLNSKETLEVGLDRHHLSNAVLALGHDDDVQAYTGTFDDDSYDDVDQFMDQFMEHYDRVDREEDEQDDTTRLGQEAPSQKEYDDVMPIDKRVVDDDNEMPMIPLRPRSTPSMAAGAATSLVDMASTLSGSETMSPISISTFPDINTNAILAPTLRSRTRMKTMDAATTASVNLDIETDDSPSCLDLFLYTYPYPSSRQNGEMERLASLSIPSVSDSTPPASVTCSPSESTSVSRSRSFSSTHTTLSFGSESESSCPQSPPPMPFSSSEDINYIVSSHFSISPVLPPDTARDDDTKTNNSSSPTTYLIYDDDDDEKEDVDNGVRIEDRGGEEAGESFDRQIWAERKSFEDKVLSQKPEEGIMKMGHENATEDDDVEAEVGNEVEWEYVVGDNTMVTASNGRLDAAHNGHARNGEEHAIAIVMPDPLLFEPDTMTTTRYSPPTTTLTTPAMTLHTLLEDDLTCESSTAVAAALATSMWKQDACELAEDLSSSTHRSNGSAVSHAIRTQLSSTPSISSTRNPSSRFPIASDESESSESESQSEDEDEDDDIPLAKSIPGALTAQTTIRRQVRQEREKKKQEKVLRRLAESTRTRLTTLRATGATPSSLSSSRGDTPSQQQVGRPRIHTLTGKSSILFNSFSPEDLARKLRDINGPDGVQVSTASAPVSRTSLYPQEQLDLPTRHRSKSMTRPVGDTLPTETLPPLPQGGSHAQRTNSMKEPSSSYHYHTHSSPTHIPAPYRSLSRSRNSLERMRISDSTPAIPGRMSYDDHHKLSKSHHYESSSSRSGADKPQRATSHRNRPVPVPVPSTSSPANASPVVNTSKPELVVQQRVFISSMQRFNMVEISESTTAGDVIRMIEAEGSLRDFTGSGGWMVFEVAQDFGMGTFFIYLFASSRPQSFF